MSGDALHPESTTLIDTIAVADLWIFGVVCEGGCCRPIRQKVMGKVYRSGDSFMSWYLPSDPMRGGTYSTEEALVGQRSIHIWKQWADATE